MRHGALHVRFIESIDAIPMSLWEACFAPPLDAGA